MTERIRYSTAYIHEFAAKIEEMVFDGYRVDHSVAFCAKRRGSAYEIHFIPTREVVDFDDYFPWTEEEEQALTEVYEEMAQKRVAKSSGAGKAVLDAAFANLDIEENCNHIDHKAIEELNQQLTIQQKWEMSDDIDAEFDVLIEQSEPLPKELLDRVEALRDKAEANREREDTLNELAQQSQELGMYEVDKEQVKVYSKEELDELYWTDLQEVGYKFGVKGRNRNKLTKVILEAQEKNELE